MVDASAKAPTLRATPCKPACLTHFENGVTLWEPRSAPHKKQDPMHGSLVAADAVWRQLEPTHRCVAPANRLGFVLRRLYRLDCAAVTRLLWPVPLLYPNGEMWLSRRLDDALADRARCTVALANGHPVGIAIDTPKGDRRSKLSTIWVDPRFRGFGVGSALIREVVGNWQRLGVTEAHVTTDTSRVPIVLPLFDAAG